MRPLVIGLKIVILIFNFFVYLFIWSAFLGAEELVQISYDKPYISSDGTVTINIVNNTENRYRIKPISDYSLTIYDETSDTWIDSKSIWSQMPELSGQMTISLESKSPDAIRIKYGIQNIQTGKIIYSESRHLPANKAQKIQNNTESKITNSIQNSSSNALPEPNKLQLFKNFITSNYEFLVFLTVFLMFVSLSGLKIIREKEQYNVQYNP